MADKPHENWGSAGPYEQYVGRWSRKIAREFLAWLHVAPGQTWGDVGCGTGALVDAILARFNPKTIAAIDRSEGFIAEARHRIDDPRVRFKTGDAATLPWSSHSFDVTVSGLVLNFVSDHGAMVCEMARVTKSGGKVAAYVWDYASGMQMMRHFWDAAILVSPHDSQLDQAERFPICQTEPLQELFRDLGLAEVSCRAIEIPMVFRDFADYWNPFLGKQGAAPTYLATVDDETRERIRALLHSRLAPAADGTIKMTAKAWAVQGVA
jgi:trans-aconitate methyltransferase